MGQMNEMVELMVEAVCSKKKNLRVAGNDFPQAVVKSRLRVRLPPGEHHLGAEHEAVPADGVVQCLSHD